MKQISSLYAIGLLAFAVLLAYYNNYWYSLLVLVLSFIWSMIQAGYDDNESLNRPTDDSKR